MRCILQRIIFAVDAALFDGARFFADRQHGGTEPVEFGLGFRFRRFDHQRTWNRPAHCWRMETAVDQPLGYVVDADARALHQRPRIDNTLVRDAIVATLVKYRICALEPLGDIVGAEDRNAGRLRQASPAHQKAIAPRNRQD